jgi:hypothetical protein
MKAVRRILTKILGAMRIGRHPQPNSCADSIDGEHQLSKADLSRIARHHKNIEDWPGDGDDELLHPSAFADCGEMKHPVGDSAPHSKSQLA